MGKLIVVNNLSLDGVMQAPGRPDEDTRDGFTRGGWAAPYSDEVMGRVMGQRMADPGPLLLGRRTYEDFYSYWPHQTDNPYTDVLTKVQKYVASTTLTEPLPWANSTVLTGDVVDAVTALKAGPENIGVLGSGELLRTLIRHGLVDEYVLLIYPLVLGTGRRMFDDDGTYAALQLVDSVTTTTGVVIATYRTTA
ncbi:MAG TPA: dihydrofolate reductase family protein [Nocardioidaceae bacterium]|nr:dihydrofolate reductase family protein [Nocardioidaceae bacterium]